MNESRKLTLQSCVLAGQRGQARLPDHELIVVALWCSIERPFTIKVTKPVRTARTRKASSLPLTIDARHTFADPAGDFV